MFKNNLIFVIAVVLIVLGLPCRANEVADQDGHFAATFPSTAAKQSVEADTPAGKMTSYLTACSVDTARFYVVYSDLPGAQSSQASAADMYQGAIQQSIKAVGGVLRSQVPFKVDNIEGVEYIVDAPNPKRVIRSRIFLVGNRTFQIVYFGAPGTEKDKLAEDFLNSLKLLH